MAGEYFFGLIGKGDVVLISQIQHASAEMKRSCCLKVCGKEHNLLENVSGQIKKSRCIGVPKIILTILEIGQTV